MKKMHRGGLFVGIGLLLGIPVACGVTSTEDSQTHWLDECQTSTECGGGLSCQCGRCVVTCTAGMDCAVPGGASASCFEPSSTAVSALCGAAAAAPQPAICLADCTGSCPAGEECAGGGCVPVRNGDGGSGGGGGAGSGGSGGEDSSCYGPHQNAERSQDPGAVGCDCGDTRVLDVCAPGSDGGWHALLCNNGRWLGVEDGPCAPIAGADCTATQSCPTGESCSIGALGNRNCAALQAEATSCTNPDHSANECCTSADCASGTCRESIFYPTGPCGGGGADSVNLCLADECESDADCAANQVCIWDRQANTAKSCLPVFCKTAADCTAEPGGQCIWIEGGCCGGVGSGFNTRSATLGCVYPSDWCHDDVECPQEAPFCVVDDGRAHCSAECRAPS